VPSGRDHDLFARALALPALDRARLARELIASLEEGDDGDAAARWLLELERRLAQVEAASVPLEDWRTLRALWAERWRK
jgi:hypothetical protein